jgi:hypothetical protein
LNENRPGQDEMVIPIEGLQPDAAIDIGNWNIGWTPEWFYSDELRQKEDTTPIRKFACQIRKLQ